MSVLDWIFAWVLWLSPLIIYFVIGGFTAAREVKSNHLLFTFLKKNAVNMEDFAKELTKGREDLAADDEDLQEFVKENNEILAVCAKIYELDKRHIHKRWVNPVTEIHYLLARRRILKEAM